MNDKDKKREIPIVDASEEAAAVGEHKPADDNTREATVMKEQAAAKVYQQHAEEVTPEAGEAHGEPAKPEKPEKEPLLKFMKKDKSKEEELKKQIAELQDKLLRSVAEFDNFRKRTERERLNLVARANSNMVNDLLPTMDNFHLALQADPANHDSFRAGVEMIHKQLAEALGKHGVELIEAEGKHFNPEEHEALMSESNADYQEGDIIQVLQAGYKIKGQVLRPARVKVASAPPQQTRNDATEQDD